MPGRASVSIPGSSTENKLVRATSSGQFSFFTTSFTIIGCYSAAMASIRSTPRQDGSTAHRVFFRHLGKQTCYT